jgi:hypothetical protein
MCGGVVYALHGELRPVWNCHCERCRRFTGHHMAATAVPPDCLVFVVNETLAWFDPVDSVHYGFCRRCGSSLFWRTDGDPTKVCVAAGTLDQPTGLSTTTAWWVAEAGDYHDRQAGLVEHPGDGA